MLGACTTIQEIPQIPGQRRGILEPLARARMRELELVRVKRVAREDQLGQRLGREVVPLVEAEGLLLGDPVELVADDRKAALGEMQPDLVLAPGLRVALEKREVAVDGKPPEGRERRLAALL